MAQVIVADTDPDFLKTATALLENTKSRLLGSCEGVPAVRELLDEGQPAVILLGPNLPASEWLPLVQELSVSRPEVATVLVVPKLTTQALQEALRSGIRDVIGAPLKEKELEGALARAQELSDKIGRALGRPGALGPEEGDGGAKVVTLFSTKGGVGKTVIATNTAVGLALQGAGKVILVDLDLQFGDAGVMLHLLPERTIFDIVPAIDRLDEEMMEGFLTSHSSGLKVLLAPTQPDMADEITTTRIAKILGTLKSMADYIVLDTPASFNDSALSALDIANEIYVVATMDVPSVKNVKLALQTMELLDYPDERVKVILNRADSKVGLQPTEVEKSLGKKISCFVPSDRMIPRSVNRGVPVVIEAPKSPVAQSFFDLVDLVTKATHKVSKVAD